MSFGEYDTRCIRCGHKFSYFRMIVKETELKCPKCELEFTLTNKIMMPNGKESQFSCSTVLWGMNEMTNLKTLKDIEEWCRLSESENHFGMYMRDAAKGWIEELEKGEKDYPLDELPDDIIACNATTYGEIIGYDAKSWIKHFFNLDDVECDK